jgi:hypothetical protein
MLDKLTIENLTLVLSAIGVIITVVNSIFISKLQKRADERAELVFEREAAKRVVEIFIAQNNQLALEAIRRIRSSSSDFKNNNQLRIATQGYVNALDELACLYQAQIVPKRLVFELMGDDILKCYDCAELWVGTEREDYYPAFEKMCADMKERFGAPDKKQIVLRAR